MSETALVLVDYQHDFWTPDVRATNPELPARLSELLTFARGGGVDVVHVRARFRADGSDWMARYRRRGWIPCIEGTDGVETLSWAAEGPGEPVVVKQSFDGFLGTELRDVLTSGGAQHLLIAGLVTSTCVLFTAATATQLGYQVSVVSDCCSDGIDSHLATLANYPFVFDTVQSDELVTRSEA